MVYRKKFNMQALFISHVLLTERRFEKKLLYGLIFKNFLVKMKKSSKLLRLPFPPFLRILCKNPNEFPLRIFMNDPLNKLLIRQKPTQNHQNERCTDNSKIKIQLKFNLIFKLPRCLLFEDINIQSEFIKRTTRGFPKSLNSI